MKTNAVAIRSARRFRRDLLPEALRRRDIWIRCARGELSYADLQQQMQRLEARHGDRIHNREVPLL